MDIVRALLASSLLLWVPSAVNSQTTGTTVRARVEVAVSNSVRASSPDPNAVVVWLSPRSEAPAHSPVPGHFRMEQKNKSFRPHLLVVPLGSSVEFPNLDPFFHNVFSQFNGKRFDLGLYEAGSTRTVRFDHEGVSYIFCNIHPKMAAVIVTLTTPYFGVTHGTGTVDLRGVPAGDYTLRVWAEGQDAAQLAAITRAVHVGGEEVDLGSIRLSAPAPLVAHKNKFGEEYPAESAAPYP